MIARFVVIPLRFLVRRTDKKSRLGVKTHIHEAALRPSGNAAAVNRTAANSYDLAFQVERKWHRNRLYVVQS